MGESNPEASLQPSQVTRYGRSRHVELPCRGAHRAFLDDGDKLLEAFGGIDL